MRLHAVHLRGLVAPRGALSVAVHGGYTLVTGEEAALATVRAALLALLCPARTLQDLEALRDPASSEAPRAVLTFRVGSDVYRTAADLARGRLVLAKHAPQTGRFQRLTSDPSEIEERLSALGRPDPEVLARLCVIGKTDPEGPFASAPLFHDAAPPAGSLEPESLLDDDDDADTPVHDEQEDPEPVPEGSERITELERQEKQLREDLEAYAPLLEESEELEPRIDRYREVRDECDRGLVAVERLRRSISAQRGELARVPRAQAPWIWLGAGLTVSGGLAGTLLDPFVGLLAAVGLGTVTTGLLIGRRARRRLGQLDARLAAMRIRERTLEQRFESEAAPVRALVVALELDGVDALEAELVRARELVRKLDEVRRLLEEERERVTRDRATVPMLSGPGRRRRVEKPPTPPPTPTRPDLALARAPSPSAEAPGGDPLPPLLQAVARWTSRGVDDVVGELGICLPLYLRAVGRGGIRDLPTQQAVQSLTTPGAMGALSPSEKQQALLAIRFALLERIGLAHRLPLVVGPVIDGVSELDHPSLGRALARLAQVVQVIQMSCDPEPWRSFADGVQPVDSRTG